MKFKYKDKVRIIGDGFYSGLDGRVNAFSDTLYNYEIHLDIDGTSVFLKEEELKEIKDDRFPSVTCPNCHCNITIWKL